MALLFTGCTLPTFGGYKGSTSQGRTEFHLWQGFFITGIVVGGLVFLLIVWTVFRYRKSSDAIPVQSQYHTLTEIIYTAVPIVIVLVLFVFTVLAENNVDAVATNPATEIHVYAFQWGWEFKYPGGVKIIGQTTQAPTVVIPANETVRIDLKSLDVLHGFYVPAFNFSRYASPDYYTTFDLNALHTGTYRGQCTQLCGLYHSLMFFNVKAVTPAQYDQWLHAQQALVRSQPGSVPKLPSGVNSSAPAISTNSHSGGDPSSD